MGTTVTITIRNDDDSLQSVLAKIDQARDALKHHWEIGRDFPLDTQSYHIQGDEIEGVRIEVETRRKRPPFKTFLHK